MNARPSGPRPPREATRERLFRAALELFAEQGFSGTTVEQIAARAGVAKGTVFYNFAAKEQLFVELLRHGAHRLSEAFRAGVKGRTGRAAVDALVRTELEQIRANPAFAQVFVAELYRTGRPWQAELAGIREEVGSVVREVITKARADAGLDADVDADFAAGALLGATLVVALDWLAFTPERSLDEVHAATMRMVLGRLRAGDATAGDGADDGGTVEAGRAGT